MNYNDIYLKSKNTWGDAPSKLMILASREIPKESNVLDLGSAQGRDALFLQSLCHNVVAIDKSEVACNQLKEFVAEKNIKNIAVYCMDVSEFEIEKNKFSIINIQNTLQFLEKDKSLKILKNIKENLVSGGIAVVSLFTIDDESFKNKNKGIRSHFDKQELLRQFDGFEIISYLETMVPDKGHPGFEEPHLHGIAKIVARKK